MRSDSIPSATKAELRRAFTPAPRHSHRSFNLQAAAALAAAGLTLGLAPSATGRARRARSSLRRSVASSLRPSSGSQKYPGQRTRHLVGASRPMTPGEILAHNRELAERKERAA